MQPWGRGPGWADGALGGHWQDPSGPSSAAGALLPRQPDRPAMRHGALPLSLPVALHALPAGKTRGMGAGRKLRLHRKDERWADKDYKKSHLGSEWKKPFAGASHAKGIVLEKM